MNIKKLVGDKKRYMNLLILADKQEEMIEKYLERGIMYILEENGVKAECVITDEGEGVLEIKNIAVESKYQGKGYGKARINYLIEKYRGSYRILQVGTGDRPLTIPFYEKCGFKRHHVVKNFFIDNYDHTIIECVKKLVDMIYLQRKIMLKKP